MKVVDVAKPRLPLNVTKVGVLDESVDVEGIRPALRGQKVMFSNSDLQDSGDIWWERIFRPLEPALEFWFRRKGFTLGNENRLLRSFVEPAYRPAKILHWHVNPENRYAVWFAGNFGKFSYLVAKNYRPLAVNNSLSVQQSSPSREPSDIQSDSGCNNQSPSSDGFWPESLLQVIECLSIGALLLVCGSIASWRKAFCGFWWGLLACLLNIGGLGMFLLAMIACNQNGNQYGNNGCSHSAVIVPHKYPLTNNNYWGTVIGTGRMDMPNVLSTEKQVAVISALAEGAGIRQIERITGVHRDTIMRLGVRVGNGCANLLDHKMRDLPCNHLQFDEVWGFIGKKERHCTPDDSPEVGDVWTFCAIDSDTKLVPSFKVGKRDAATANAFVADVASRLKNRVQISSDALRAYVDAVEMAFGANVDFAQIVKTYVHEDAQNAERKYSAPEFVIEEKKRVCGMPDLGMASTSHIERLNGTTRLHMRRLTRLTYAFSKKRENFEAAVALHFAYYNFVKRHNTLRCTPAMAAGIERDFWTVRELVEAAA